MTPSPPCLTLSIYRNERNGGHEMIGLVIGLVNRWLAGQSTARAMAIRECNRRIGFARYHARQAMERAALCDSLDTKTGPGFLPAVVWRTLPYIDLRKAL